MNNKKIRTMLEDMEKALREQEERIDLITELLIQKGETTDIIKDLLEILGERQSEVERNLAILMVLLSRKGIITDDEWIATERYLEEMRKESTEEKDGRRTD